MKLEYKITDIKQLSEHRKKEMFKLMVAHYSNVVWDTFVSDLSEKNWVIQLFTPNNILVGFSTQQIIIPENQIHFSDSVVIYSGDTIIDHAHWGTVTLPVAFLQLISNVRDLHPNKKIYWMLISKGLRTYKFLSVFLTKYYPCYFDETPQHIKDFMHHLGTKKFGKSYLPEKGIIEARTNGQYLKEDFQPEIKQKKPVAEFFFDKNPHFNRGDELLCLAEISDANLHPFIKRIAANYVE